MANTYEIKKSTDGAGHIPNYLLGWEVRKDGKFIKGFPTKRSCKLFVEQLEAKDKIDTVAK